MSAYLSERVAYLKGLSDGLGIQEENAEGKLLLKIIDVLQDVADAVDEVQNDVDELDEYVEAMDEDLSDLEELFEDEDEDDEEDFLEIECPHCHETVYFDEEMLGKEELICPECHQPIFEDEEGSEESSEE